MDSTTRLKLDVCDVWPKHTPIGTGWARFSHLMLHDSKLSHSSAPAKTPTKKRFPVGFAQTAFPLTIRHPYFELEICSRGLDRAIAIGLGPRTHSSNEWIGWVKGSIGYHCDDGSCSRNPTQARALVPRPTLVMSLAVVLVSTSSVSPTSLGVRGKLKVEVFFTLNGALLNTQKVTIPPEAFSQLSAWRAHLSLLSSTGTKPSSSSQSGQY